MANTTNAPLNLPPDPQETRRQVRLAWGLVVMGVACALLGGLIYGGSLILDWIDDRVFTDAPESAVVVDTGELVIAGESWVDSELDPLALENLHIQQVVKATCGDKVGHGVLEQMHIGPSSLLGFDDWFDGAK